MRKKFFRQRSAKELLAAATQVTRMMSPQMTVTLQTHHGRETRSRPQHTDRQSPADGSFGGVPQLTNESESSSAVASKIKIVTGVCVTDRRNQALEPIAATGQAATAHIGPYQVAENATKIFVPRIGQK